MNILIRTRVQNITNRLAGSSNTFFPDVPVSRCVPNPANVLIENPVTNDQRHHHRRLSSCPKHGGKNDEYFIGIPRATDDGAVAAKSFVYPVWPKFNSELRRRTDDPTTEPVPIKYSF